MTKADFERIHDELVNLGFRLIASSEVRKAIKEKNLVSPRKREGREAGFVFERFELKVVVWTTWLIEEQKMREEDNGWVLIEGLNGVEYFSHPLNRTRHFVSNLLSHAWIARERIRKRPICPECEHEMNITPGKALKSRYWICTRYQYHSERNMQYRDWDWALHNKPRALKFVKGKRKARARYKKKLAKEGKSPVPRVLTRRPWQSRQETNSV